MKSLREEANQRAHKGVIEETPEMATAIFRFISRNQVNDNWRATGEELLLEIVAELRDAYDDDLTEMRSENRSPTHDGSLSQYPRFMHEAKLKADLFKDDRGHKRLCSVPSFAHGLVMASRIKRHYTHAEWFTVGALNKMLDVHGAVSNR